MPSVRIRVDEDLKNAAADVLAQSDLTVSDAIRMLFLKIIQDGAMPFDIPGFVKEEPA